MITAEDDRRLHTFPCSFIHSGSDKDPNARMDISCFSGMFGDVMVREPFKPMRERFELLLARDTETVERFDEAVLAGSDAANCWVRAALFPGSVVFFLASRNTHSQEETDAFVASIIEQAKTTALN